MAISKENQKAIVEMKANNKWAWGFIITIGISFITYFITRS
ncbi:hemolysin XhlA family protein [Carnobacterium maltaromaticum]